MQSIRSFLFINLVFSLIVVIAIALVGNVSFSHKIFKEELNIRLAGNAVWLNTFLNNVNISDVNIGKLQSTINQLPNTQSKGEYFKIYDNAAKILLESSNLKIPPTIIKNSSNGFQDIKIDGILWRLFIYHDLENKKTITTFQRYDIYNATEKRLIQNSIFILLITIPFLSILILAIVNKGLGNIKEVIAAVKNRAPNNLKPVDIKQIPKEIKPLITELNNLFEKLQEYLDREKRFAANAAHELRTPLAALKIQAQVALNINDEEEMKSALRNIIKGVDRSTHIVSQLLTLSRAIPEVYSNKNEMVSLVKEAQQVIIDLIQAAKQKNIDIELIASDKTSLIHGNPISINILIKNLVDNALRYTPANGQVQIVIEEAPSNIILKVIDNGPGIPPELREKVFDRFFRIVGNKAPGSGLGLSIVKQIADLYNAKIELNTPASGKGLVISVTFPKNPVKTPNPTNKSKN